MAWTTNQIWRWTHITFATLFLAELLFGAISGLIGAGEDWIFVGLLLAVSATGFAKWPLYPWYMKRKSESKGRFKFFEPRNGNQTWRWIHIATGSLWVVLLADGLFLNYMIFGEEESTLTVIAFLIAFFGTIISGLAKWPIYPWYKKRKNRKKRAAKAAASDATTEEN